MLQKIKVLLSSPTAGFSGYIPDKPDSRDYVRELKANNAPAAFSLRENGREFALDQKQVSSCTGYSSSAFMSCLHGVFRSGKRWEASPLFIYYKTRQLYGTLDYDSGAPLRDTMKALQQFGVCPMSEHPDLYNWRKAPTPEAEKLASLLRVKDYQRIVIDDTAPATMIDTLHRERLPILIGVALFPSSQTTAVRFSGNIPIPGSAETSTGGHAMMIDAYDQEKQLFYGWNSWGKGWGARGRFSLPFAYFTSYRTCLDIWTVTYRYW